MSLMNALATLSIVQQLALGGAAIYLLGIVIFVLFYRHSFADPWWFQVLVTALAWPLLAVLIAIERRRNT